MVHCMCSLEARACNRIEDGMHDSNCWCRVVCACIFECGASLSTEIGLKLMEISHFQRRGIAAASDGMCRHETGPRYVSGDVFETQSVGTVLRASSVLREITHNTANIGPFWAIFGWYRPAGSKYEGSCRPLHSKTPDSARAAAPNICDAFAFHPGGRVAERGT